MARASALLVVALVACVGNGQRNRDVIATVEGVPIYVDDFDRALRRLRIDEGTPDAAALQRTKQLADLIDRQLLLRAAERQPIVVGMDEVEALYERTRSGWEAERNDQPCEECRFQTVLAEQDLTPAELKQVLRQQLMIKRYLEDQVFVRVAVTETELQAYVQAHAEVAEAPEQVHAAQIVVKTRAEAEAIRGDLLRGTSFEDAALKYSLSPEGQKGGDLGTFARGVMPKVFDGACFQLAAGAISEVVASDYGFHLFKVYERLPGHPRDARAVRASVEARLLQEKRRTAEVAAIATLRATAKIAVEEDLLAQSH